MTMPPHPQQPEPDRPDGAADGSAHRRSIDALVREQHRLLHSFLMARLHDEQDARDVAQEAYVRMLNLSQPGAVSFMRAYLFKTAANLAMDRMRQRQVRKHDPIETGEEVVDELTPDRRVLSREDVEILEKALQELSPKCRSAFLLHRIEEWDEERIAAHLGILPRMVRRYLTRARVYCRLRVRGLTAEEAKAATHETS